MSSTPKTFKLAGAYFLPDELYHDALKKHVQATIDAIKAGGPSATAGLPPPPSQCIPVVEKDDGSLHRLVEPPRDHRVIQAKLGEQERQIAELFRRPRNGDEWSQAFFKRLRDIADERRALLNKTRPAARPVARPFSPPNEASLDPNRSEIGGFLKINDLPIMPGAYGPGWAAEFLTQIPTNLELSAKNRQWQGETRKVHAQSNLSKRREADEWRQAHFKSAREATSGRNPIYESGKAQPLGGNFFAKGESWTKDDADQFDEYHESHFANERRKSEQQIQSSGAVKKGVPIGVFATPANPTAPDGTAEFLATPHVFGEMRDMVLLAVKTGDASALQAYLKQMLVEKQTALADPHGLLASLMKARDMLEAQS